jgi:hypothetical protein
MEHHMQFLESTPSYQAKNGYGRFEEVVKASVTSPHLPQNAVPVPMVQAVIKGVMSARNMP